MKLQIATPPYLLRVIVVTALAFVLVNVGLPTFGKPKPHHTSAAQADEIGQSFEISGTVESINFAVNSVRINASGQHVDVLVTPTTAIEFRGELGSIADIHRGRKISASGVVRNGALIANSVTLR